MGIVRRRARRNNTSERQHPHLDNESSEGQDSNGLSVNLPTWDESSTNSIQSSKSNPEYAEVVNRPPGGAAFESRGSTKRKKPSRAFKLREMFQGDQEPRVFVPRWVCERSGGGYPAIMASQIVYWNKLTADGHLRLTDNYGSENRPWTPSYKEIFRQTGIPKQKARCARKRLEDLRLIETVAIQSRPSEIYLTASFAAELSREQLLDSRLHVPGTLVWGLNVVVTKTGNQAIILSNILPWFELNQHGKPKTRIVRDGHYWRANTYEELAEETGLTLSQVRRAITFLRDNQLIVTARYKFKGQQTLHVRPNEKILQQRMESCLGQLSHDRRPA